MMVNILSEILERKREAVARLRTDRAGRDFRNRALAIRTNATPHALSRALVKTPLCGVRSAQRAAPTFNIIAEFKRRSPSAGTIRKDLSANDVATRFARGGACAISVLTDEHYFGDSGKHGSSAVTQRFYRRRNSDLRSGCCRCGCGSVDRSGS